MSSETTGPPSLCAWETAWLAHGLRRVFIGGRIERVEAPTPETFVLRLFVGGREQVLVLWSAPKGAVVFPTHPGQARLRADVSALGDWAAVLKGGRIAAIDHAFPWRLLAFTVEREGRSRRLVVDPVKAGGNLYLVGDDGRIERRWRSRGFTPGERFDGPASTPFPPSVLDVDADPPAAGINRRFLARLRNLPESLRARLATLEPDVTLLAALYGTTAGDFLSFWSEECARAWQAHLHGWRQQERVAPLEKERARLVRALERLSEDRRALGDPEVLRRRGDLLAAHLSHVAKGMEAVEVEDLFSPSGGTVRVPLDPAKGPQENLSAAYARYAKARRGLADIDQRDAQRRQRLAELEAEIGRLRTAEPDDDSAAAVPAAPRAPVPPKAAKPLPKGIQRFLTRDGCELYLGRNAEGNDRLVRQILRGHDHWFHVADGTGSHVVLRSPAKGQEPAEAIMWEAARLAHFNSSLRDEKATVVVCVPGKWVRRVKGGPPGRVTYSHPRTFRVDPDPALFSRLSSA